MISAPGLWSGRKGAPSSWGGYPATAWDSETMGQDFTELRRAMVDSQVRTTGVTDRALIEALFSVPREAFVPTSLRQLAYIDDHLLLNPDADEARYLMEPSPFAKLVQLAQVQPSDLILDIGCGLGYSSAVLSHLGAAVIALESDEALAAQATDVLSETGFDSVAVVTGSLGDGLADEGPYDVIVLGGAVDEVPQTLLDQLRPGGRLVTVIASGGAGVAMLYLRDDEGVVSQRRGANLSVKPLQGFEKEAEFVF